MCQLSCITASSVGEYVWCPVPVLNEACDEEQDNTFSDRSECVKVCVQAQIGTYTSETIISSFPACTDSLLRLLVSLSSLRSFHTGDHTLRKQLPYLAHSYFFILPSHLTENNVGLLTIFPPAAVSYLKL